MKTGDTLEAAVWIDGTETKELRERFENDVREQMRERCFNAGVLHGPVVSLEKRIGEDRVPAPPDHIQGPDVRLLVGEAQIMGEMLPPAPFTSELTAKDLEQLRTITRREFAARGKVLTDAECDAIINDLGPELAAWDSVRN